MKGKLLLVTVALFVLSNNLDSPVAVASRDLVDPCSSYATVPGPALLIICPWGDGKTLSEVGAVIEVTMRDPLGVPIVGIPASDFLLIGCANELCLCGGSGSINADGPTNANGLTTISGTLAAGGYASGVQVVVQGVTLADPTDWSIRLCLPITMMSIDFNCDLVVDIIDVSVFGQAFPSPPHTYDPRFDFNGDGLMDIIDFSIFGQHFLHSC